MRFSRKLQVLTIVLALFMLAACAPLGGNLDATSWQLTRYRDSSGNMVPVQSHIQVTALFQADKVSGLAACNNYSSSYQAGEGRLTFGPTATTRKVCALPLGTMKQEGAYLTALGQVEGYKMGGNSLTMLDGHGDVLLEFEPLTN